MNSFFCFVKLTQSHQSKGNLFFTGKFMVRSIIPFALLFLIPLTVFSKVNKYGVFVGVGKYPKETSLRTLSSSVRDATEICKAFAANCGEGYTELILDEKATRRNIIQSISKYQITAKEGDLFVFYYSGHGTLFPDRLSEELDEKITLKTFIKTGKKQATSKPEKYDAAIIPYDSVSNSDNKLWRNLILDDELYRLFAGFTKNGVRVVFISDSCYSGGQAKGLEFANKNTKEIINELGEPKFLDWKVAIGVKGENDLNKEMLKQIEFKPDPSLEDRYIMVASSDEYEPSFARNPDTGLEMSLFTYYFLKIFNEYKESKKLFTFETILKEIKPKVEAYVKKYKESQTPKIDTSFYKRNLNISVF